MEQFNIEEITQQIMSLYINVCSENRKDGMLQCKKLFDLPITEIDGVKLNMGDGMNTTCIWIQPNLIRLTLRIHNLAGESFQKITNKAQSSYAYTMNAIPYDKEVDAYTTRFTMLEVREGVENMVNMISTLSYDILNGCFTEPHRRRKTKDYPECCVCYEETKITFKSCKHSVCGLCISNMIGRLTCPICRLLIN
jgi:hypothetical protein